MDRGLVQRGDRLHLATLSDKKGLKHYSRDWNSEGCLPSNNSVFPEPNLPQIRESSPCGKSNDKSANINLCLGVAAAEAARLVVLRS